MEQLAKNNKKVENSWALFDWANSAYALVISTAIFPPFFLGVTNDKVEFFGTAISNSALYSYTVSFAFLVLVVLSPLISGISDYGGRRKFFLKFFTILGSLSCAFLFFFEDHSFVWYAVIAFALATLGFTAGTVFYNAYLPEIVTEDRYDKVSAKGFTYGYIGSVLLLIFILVMMLKPELFGMVESTLQARIGFLLVGVWWLVFGFISLNGLPKDKSLDASFGKLLKNGLGELKVALSKVKNDRNLSYFLSAFFFYIAGVNTVIYLATIFAKKILGFEQSDLIITVLILQLVAIGGAYFFAYLASKKGSKISLLSMVTIWIIVCILAYFVEGKTGFYFIAALVGLIMGGIQAVSRSSYSKMIDQNKGEMASFFSFYDAVKNIAIVLGTFLFGIVDNITGNMRYSILTLIIFFAMGFLLLLKVNFEKYKNTNESLLVGE